MNIIKITDKDKIEATIKEIFEDVKKGAVFCYPTDTVYGLGSGVYNINSIEKIYRLKNREKKHPFSIMIGNILELKELVSEVSEPACILIEKFWPGALTIIFNASEKVKKKMLRKRNTVGIRFPDNKICGFLVKYSGLPIITTSANLSGKKAPKSIEEISQEIKNNCDIIIDNGEIQSQGESTIIDVTQPLPMVIREGAIPVEKIKQYINIVKSWELGVKS